MCTALRTSAAVPAESVVSVLGGGSMNSGWMRGLSSDYDAQVVASNVYEVQEGLAPFRVSAFRAGERDHLLSYHQGRPSFGRAAMSGGE